mmetsp:Transcript_10214/g.24035  ORF Transcript_10214/g.24035 Transcript_10214/m.24035 type:complete len:112 (+) Transcript_10214:108-443(+)
MVSRFSVGGRRGRYKGSPLCLGHVSTHRMCACVLVGCAWVAILRVVLTECSTNNRGVVERFKERVAGHAAASAAADEADALLSAMSLEDAEGGAEKKKKKKKKKTQRPRLP